MDLSTGVLFNKWCEVAQPTTMVVSTVSCVRKQLSKPWRASWQVVSSMDSPLVPVFQVPGLVLSDVPGSGHTSHINSFLPQIDLLPVLLQG